MVLLFFFDICRPRTLDEAKYYLTEIRRNSTIVPIALIGNKCDFDQCVNDNDIKELEKEYNAKYFKVSVKNNSNINEVIDYLITEAANIIYEDKNQILDLLCNEETKCTIF